MSVLTPTDRVAPQWSATSDLQSRPLPRRNHDRAADARVSPRVVLPAVVAVSAALWVALFLAAQQVLHLI